MGLVHVAIQAYSVLRHRGGGPLSEDVTIDPFAKIVNQRQRDALVRAIEAREDIPDYAWTPLPADVTDELWEEIRAMVRPAAEKYVRDLLAGKAEPL